MDANERAVHVDRVRTVEVDVTSSRADRVAQNLDGYQARAEVDRPSVVHDLLGKVEWNG